MKRPLGLSTICIEFGVRHGLIIFSCAAFVALAHTVSAVAQDAPTPEQMAQLVASRSQEMVGQEMSKGLRVISVASEGAVVVRRDAVVDFELLDTLTAAPEAVEDLVAPHYRAETCANPIAQVLIAGGVSYRLILENAAGGPLVTLDVDSCEAG